jgi:uncharacterized protein (TIGR03435 family)
MRTSAALAVFLASVASAVAQPGPAFEVASVKVAPPRSGPSGFTALDTDPAMVRYSNITLQNLIAMAYRMDSDRVRGPAWLSEQMYDVAAKLPAGASKDQVPRMLQSLLAERFKLASHRESREQRAWFLVVGKNGSRLKKAQEAADSDLQQVRGSALPAQIWPGGIRGRAIPIAILAGMLTRATGSQVVDRTGLAGAFDIDLKWTPDGASGSEPGIFTAVQEQLGLKLEPGKAPLEVLVIDRAERIPVAE